MIALLTGKLVAKDAGTLVVDVGGVGYLVHAPGSTYYRLPEPPADVRLMIKTVVREDSITLYGFDDARERDLFDLFQTVSGIGPKMALAILSGMPFEMLVRAIAEEDIRSLTKIPGMGKKTAERVVLELKKKVSEMARNAVIDLSSSALSGAAWDAISALENLGYSRVEAERAVNRVLKDEGAELELERIITSALRELGKSYHG